MLEPFLHKLASQRIVLASGSPRRRQILENVRLKFEVVTSNFEENLDKLSFTYPYEYVLETARIKTQEVADRLAKDQKPPNLVIGADTVVTMDNKIYEKPRNKEQAFEMLSSFSGKKHMVYTGVVLLSPRKAAEATGYDMVSFYESTEVEFADLSPEIIHAYIATGAPMDKAGGYGIQDAGGTLVKAIHGDYFNVMGFPLHHFCKVLCDMHAQNIFL